MMKSMQNFLNKTISPLVRRLDHSDTAQNEMPSPIEECTRFPEFPWDLRTVIAVFPPEAPFHFLNLNTLLGLTGVPFDQVERLTEKNRMDPFDLQFCLEAKDKYATCKRYYSIAKELKCRPGDVFFELDDRLKFEGSWPSYRIRYTQPEDNLDISMQLDSWQGFHWWAYNPNMYCHYTTFCDCRMEWEWDGEKGEIDIPVLHDHGWGKNLLPLRIPLRVFRYEVMRLPGDAYAMSLWSEGPGRMELKNIGVLRKDREPIIHMERYDCNVIEWDVFENYAGQPCRVPRRWTGRQEGKTGIFEYEAIRNTEPRPVLGEGFLYGFEYQGQLTGAGSLSGKVEGPGYVEQLGRFLKGF